MFTGGEAERAKDKIQFSTFGIGYKECLQTVINTRKHPGLKHAKLWRIRGI